MTAEAAETLALQALAWLADGEERLGAFLAETGLAPDTLAARAADPRVLAAVLDFVLGEDSRVLAFAAAAGLAPGVVAAARAALPGGQVPHWT